MGSFLVSKISQYLLVLWIAVTLNFLLPRMMSGNPLALIAGKVLTSCRRSNAPN